MDRNSKAERLEAARKYAKNEPRLECGVVIEEGDPCNTANLLVNLDEIAALVAAIKAEREGR
ncbi:hypothetical protein AYO46_07480 [Betaproteobacteria bacterium SCGC AG-212-J23]|nr:hypothetical protein AYO46_07480 [Betaproteobacteria bacterium SCGC AG-212-J23]